MAQFQSSREELVAKLLGKGYSLEDMALQKEASTGWISERNKSDGSGALTAARCCPKCAARSNKVQKRSNLMTVI